MINRPLSPEMIKIRNKYKEEHKIGFIWADH